MQMQMMVEMVEVSLYLLFSNLSLHISVSLPICLCLFVSLCCHSLCVFLCVSLFVFPFPCLSLFLSSVYLLRISHLSSLCLCLYLSACLFLCLSHSNLGYPYTVSNWTTCNYKVYSSSVCK